MKDTFYITTTIPYVNAEPHIGFALEVVQADTIARFNRSKGKEVIFNTGTDEHGLKIYQKAQEEGKDPQKYCDEFAEKFKKLKTVLNLSYTNFIRTTDDYHKKAAQEFWNRCNKNGDIYKKMYKMKYCIGCELEKTDSDLVDGKCPLHPTKELLSVDEENYFFRFSRYTDKLLALYKNNPDFIVPDYRLKEIQSFVEKGLQDFSISRLKSKLTWGVDVPGDPNHVMYVWFDALVNYISTLSWPQKENIFKDYWPGMQIAGKDNLRQQSAIWQAMLMSAGLPPTRQILIHGFITAEGKKISKSLGNVISPVDLVIKYGTDAVRYYLLREIPPFDDGDFSFARMEELYNTDLANELGNLIMRLTTLAEKDELIIGAPSVEKDTQLDAMFENFQFNLVLEHIGKRIKKLNKTIDEFAPWKKTKDERKDFLVQSLQELHHIGQKLEPCIPHTAKVILASSVGTIHKIKPLFKKHS
ncbi:MAG: methionine--tRNA ligase [bacterium]|nr:methionine--tRNA ligase [bacterium]